MPGTDRHLDLDGTILLLGTAPDAIGRQLTGEEFSLDQVGPLRNDVSTDEITPLPTLLNFDETLARHAHTGLTVNGERPVKAGAIAKAGVSVIVAGRRYGKGSSREHSPFAERAAGVRLVIAESFERIHRCNLVGMGVLPLQFLDGQTRKSLGLDGTEAVDIIGLNGTVDVGQRITVRFEHPSRGTVAADVKCRLETAREIGWYKAGGVMPFVLDQVAQAS